MAVEMHLYPLPQQIEEIISKAGKDPHALR